MLSGGPHRFLLELFCMLDHLVGLLDQVLNSQVTGTKPVQDHPSPFAILSTPPNYPRDRVHRLKVLCPSRLFGALSARARPRVVQGAR
jgi:hypothetical protein